MKKLFLIKLTLIYFAFHLQGQVTLSMLDLMPVDGDNFHVMSVQNVLRDEVEKSGEAIMWNLTSVMEHAPMIISFENSIEYNSTIVEKNSENEERLFYNYSNDSQVLVHKDFGEHYVIDYSDPKEYLSFPLTYQASGVDSFFSIMNSNDLQYNRYGDFTWEVDGWGSLETNYGIYLNTLRVKHVFDYVVTSDNYVVSHLITSYRWYKEGIHYPIAKIEYYENSNSLETTSFAVFLMNTLDVQQNTNNKIEIYPNPVGTELTIQAFMDKGVDRYTIMDVFGKIVLEGGDEIIDVSTLNSGLYLIHFYNADNVLISNNKFTKH
jgi:hypothetical protein